MADFYEDKRRKVITRIKRRGRPVTLIAPGEQVSVTETPWRTERSPARELAWNALFVAVSGISRQSELARYIDLINPEKQMLCLMGVSLDFNIAQAETLRDSKDGIEWRIVSIDTLEPGPTPVLYVAIVER